MKPSQLFILLWCQCAPLGVSYLRRQPSSGTLQSNTSLPKWSNATGGGKAKVVCREMGDCFEYPAWSGDDADFSADYNVTEFRSQVEATWKTSDLHHLPMETNSLLNATVNASLVDGKASQGTGNLCMNGRLVPIMILIGAQKSATSSFAEEFAQGYNVVLPEMGSWSAQERMFFSKELHFFDYPERYNKGKNFWLQHWPTCPATHMVAAEFTPSYLSTWEAPQRIRDVYGNLVGHLTFVIILREPLSRMQSSFYHGHSSGWVSSTYANFEAYVQGCIKNYQAKQFRLFHSTSPSDNKVDHTLYGLTGIPFTLSLYYDQLKHWFWYYKSYQFVVAPMGAYTKPDAVAGVTAERNLLAKVAGRAAIQAKLPPPKPKPPRRNVHSHPKVEQDLTPGTYKQIKQLLNSVTGSTRLAELIAPKMSEGLLLYGYQGYLSNPHLTGNYRIAHYIEDNW